jgi:hypothetical protein
VVVHEEMMKEPSTINNLIFIILGIFKIIHLKVKITGLNISKLIGFPLSLTGKYSKFDDTTFLTARYASISSWLLPEEVFKINFPGTPSESISNC